MSAEQRRQVTQAVIQKKGSNRRRHRYELFMQVLSQPSFAHLHARALVAKSTARYQANYRGSNCDISTPPRPSLQKRRSDCYRCR
jgi:hypothetical protein